MILPSEDEARIQFELMYWIVPEGLEGKTFKSFKELKTAISANKSLSEAFENSFRFTKYSVKENSSNRTLDIAYYCNHCAQIIVGPPEIIAYNNIRHLSGRKGLIYNCTVCKTELYNAISKVS